MFKSSFVLIAALTLTGCQPKSFRANVTPPIPSAAPVAVAATGAPDAAVKHLLKQHDDLVAVVNLAGDLTRVKSEAELNEYVTNLDALEKTEAELVKLDSRYEDQMKKEGHRERIARNRVAVQNLRATLFKSK